MEANKNKPLKQETKDTIEISDYSDSNLSDADDFNPEIILPLGFLDPLSPEERALMNKQVSASFQSISSVANNVSESVDEPVIVPVNKFKQFWNSGQYEASDVSHVEKETCVMDRARLHPRFLHSNATSHKWALGAFAELLDNALDEVCNGASYVHVDVIVSKKDDSKMLLVEDNGGGMSPDMLRQCMSLGYSLKSNQENTIGQYGNGFKTSTMRLGADVIVFSRCRGKDGGSPTQSVGMLSLTFLKRTSKNEIVVPIIDYKKGGDCWNMIVRTSPDDWRRNLDTLLMWSPYASEEELFKEFDLIKDQGTRVVIYNLWEDDLGGLELDFDTDRHDIQIKGANRDERKIEMARNYPNSRHFLTYSHSLRSYAAILYLRIPPSFRIILRGRDVDHHNIVNDMMYKQEHIYRPARVADLVKGQSQAFANVIIGFVKDAKFHIDVQGFCVYHKNRLIKPFWRVWNAAGSGGRGIIGILEADFVNPAHDKQGFEQTNVLFRLEKRLCEIQKKYWSENCHQIGYANGKSCAKQKVQPLNKPASESGNVDNHVQPTAKIVKRVYNELAAGDDSQKTPEPLPKRRDYKQPPVSQAASSKIYHTRDHSNAAEVSQAATTKINHAQDHSNATEEIENLKKENVELREKLKKIEGVTVSNLMCELQYEKDRNAAIQTHLKNAQQKIQESDKEQETLIDIFSEERSRRDKEEDDLRMRLKDASQTIEDLAKKLKQQENRHAVSCKIER
ncbi:Protein MICRORCHIDIA like [Heracleum sosnowskyi]|uniref:Protein MICRORCHIDIA like n=1 Tax=Heracleum sosnowskyi TaxID=360622 RepID=A0AAD8IW21_9APIA|nr:Protein MICRORCHIDIA like [Heracleum sosnowskyi]